MVKLLTGLRSTRSESVPGPKDQSRRRTSKPPPAGGVMFVLIWMADELTEVTLMSRRLLNGSAVWGCCGSQASAGTVEEVLMASGSAQSLAKYSVYLFSCGDVFCISICTLRTTTLAAMPDEVAEMASRSPGQTSPWVSKFHPV